MSHPKKLSTSKIWNNRSSNRMLKRVLSVAPPRDTSPATTNKRQKRAVTPPPPPLPVPAAPESFADAFAMLQAAWKDKFPLLAFPDNQVGFFPMSKACEMMSALDNKEEEVSVVDSSNADDKQNAVPSRFVVVHKGTLGSYKKERIIARTIEKVCTRQNNSPTHHTRHLFAAFAAGHLQISPIHQEHLIALARYALVVELKAACQEKDPSIRMDWATIDNVSKSSPSATIIDSWVDDLATLQLSIFGYLMSKAKSAFVQSDGGHDGQEIRIFNIWNTLDKSLTPDGTMMSFWADLTFNGKKSIEVAAGMKLSLRRLGNEDKELKGGTWDSGQGTPESAACAMHQIGLWHKLATSDSCGIHDLQSVI